MGFEFKFEVPSDEEPEVEEELNSDGEVLEVEEGEVGVPAWDFGAYAGVVAEEHAQHNTTSVDDKISRIRSRLKLNPNNHDQPEPEPETERQDNYMADDDDDDDEDEEEDEDEDEDEDDGNDKIRKKTSFFSPSEGVSFHARSFMALNLSRPLLRACDALGYSKPTPIQAACIPLAMAGRDICASAITGSGKTAAFTLPTLERLLYRPKRLPAIRVLILTPTRELASQIHGMIQNLAQFTDIRCCLIVGGLLSKVQEAALRSMPDIVVATPGRMIDHLRNSMSVDLDDLAVLILDEADRLLEFGFSAEIQELVRMCPKGRQTMLFSATMTEKVDELVKLSLTKPLRLSADPSAKRPEGLIEEVVRIRRAREAHQEAVLLALCSKTFTSKVIIFSGTKKAAHRLKILFGLVGYKAAEFHGNLTQAQRLDSLELFRKQQVDFLITTDVSSRGLDIVGVQTVINFVCPRDLTNYLHRVGRTARAGREGCAVTFITDKDRSLLKAIAKKAGSTLKSRTVAEQSINKWVQMIEQMEDQVTAVMQEEREEMALRKAEMEAAKAENMIEHKDEIFSRPKKTWFMTEKAKKLMAKAVKGSLEKEPSSKEVVSAEQAEDLKLKEKRKREREKKLPRKKRRKLEAQREMLEDEHDSDDSEEDNKKVKKVKSGIPLVDVAYRRAKAIKSEMKGQDVGKRVKKESNHVKQPQSRTDEMQDLFQTDISDRRQKNLQRAGKKSNNSFKSKSRYKRRK
ncbi:DEAD-box ATP-dependent RNA helicase 28 [Silene latifolia]|uniref:DEAD-box ATP-dependent RNA helicase 28 n=1 Tax=Silene latifolia TaxID=37657 RepID=UPI003D771EAC